MKNNGASKILITSPSFNVDENIGGISSFTKLLIENNHSIEYVLFVRGKKDFERRGFIWLIRQPFVLLNFIKILINEKSIKIVHINMPLDSIGVVRDSSLVVKAVMDGLATMGFISLFGWGVMIAALPVLVFQGTITLACAQYLRPFLETHSLVDPVNATGGLLVCTVALVILQLKKIELADYLPSLAFAPMIAWVFR